MRIIITGGSGLIGLALTRSFVKDEHDVILLSRNPKRVSELPSGARVVQWDGATADGWSELVEGADAIINLAGENIAGEGFFPDRWTEERKRRIRTSRLNAGKAVTHAIQTAEHKPGVVVQASAIGYYGPSEDLVVTEDNPPGDDFMAEVCQDWENSTAGVEELGVRRVVTRGSIALSSEGGAFTRLLFPFKLYAGGPLGSGEQYISWIHMADQVGAIRYLIDNQAARGVFNLSSPNPVTNKEFAQTIGKVMRRPSFIPVPEFAFRTMFGEVSTVVVDGQRVHPKRLQEIGYQFKFPELEPAVRETLGK
ncbi:MAG: TIGR01777 family oxidoreductase [Anaerolineales bacterium]|nr:TIGR01777 family oxidoreductase [Anaerolineales bacterium]